MDRLEEYLNTPITEGGRNHELFKAAAFMKDKGDTINEALNTLRPKAMRDGLRLSEINRTVESAFDRPVSTVNEKAEYFKWDDMIGGTVSPPKKKVKVYSAKIPEPVSDWDKRDFYTLLKDCFQENEIINIVHDHRDNNGKLIPSGYGLFTYTTKAYLKKEGQSCEASTKTEHGKGGWIRINPLDGKGIKDANVTSFRHALIESDSMPLEKQLSVYRELKLPISAIIHSGNKSIHAWVKIGADSLEAYKKRVEYLYKVLKEQGFELDESNKNPSRLSRLPGVRRDQSKQYLIETNIGKEDWKTWVRYWEEESEGLPEISNAYEVNISPPELAPELIEGVLRKGHKFIIGGPSKAGKSFFLISMALALASGSEYAGMKCNKTKVLYLNFEIDSASFFNRINKVSEVLQIKEYENLDVWNLRGYILSLDQLAPKIVRRIKDRGYGAIVIDPIYKLLAGKDENSAGDIAELCNSLDMISVQAKTSILIASHFSKGKQGQKSSSDRISGSGVFARDPDAILTLSELEGCNDGYLLEYVLREFKSPEPKYLRWEYPVHYEDDTLKGAIVKGGKPNKTDAIQEIFFAFEELEGRSNGYLRVSDIVEKSGISDRTVRRHLKKGCELMGEKLVLVDGYVRSNFTNYT